MDIRKLFRRNIFGGFNKKDVEEYVRSLEEELEKSKSEAAGGLTEEDRSIIDESIREIQNLKTERDSLTAQIGELNRKLEEQQHSPEHASDAEIAELLIHLLAENKQLKEEKQKTETLAKEQEKDREAIKKILSDAKEQAQTLLVNAEQAAQERRRRADKELRNELENRVLDFITVNYRMTDFVKGIDTICDQLRSVSDSLKKVSEEVPARVIDLVDESERRIIEPEQEAQLLPEEPGNGHPEEEESPSGAENR